MKGRDGRETYELEEFSLLKEQDSVEMFLLDLPELSLEGSKRIPSGRWNVKCTRVGTSLSMRNSISLRGNSRESTITSLGEEEDKGEHTSLGFARNPYDVSLAFFCCFSFCRHVKKKN